MNMIKEDPRILKLKNKILLMGSPNVGKSVFFSAFTKIHVVSSNYSGTTVNYMSGDVKFDDETYTLIDVPGTYTLDAVSESEAIAVNFAKSNPEAILFVLDATNLDGSLRLALELKNYKIPTIYALNMVDVAKRKGIEIDAKKLSEELNAPVIPTVAVKEEGFEELKNCLKKILKEKQTSENEETAEEKERSEKEETTSEKEKTEKESDFDKNERMEKNVKYWEEAKALANKVTNKKESEPSRLDKLGDKMTKPWPGIPIAIVVIIAALGIVVGLGKALRAVLLLPLVNDIIVPFFRHLFTSILPEGVLLNVLVGEYGIFVISFEWILALVVPYVIIYQFVFAFLEDCGYLPRVAVLFDNVMRKIGIQGGSLISIMLAFGCAVPAIIGTRTMTTRKERLIVTTIICFAVPCISQTGALIAMTSEYSIWLFLAVLISALIIFISVALISNKLIKGKVDPLAIDIPNLLIPDRKSYFKKLKIRIKQFLWEAEGPMLFAVFIAAIFKETGMIDILAIWLEPLMVKWLGLPAEGVMALILGIIRREMSVAPLLMHDLSGFQMYIGAIVSLLYLPCLSVFGILAKEFDIKIALAIVILTTASALFIGGAINHIGMFLGFA
ncbi:MAG: ferrous iron transport protein B [Methanosarcinaceae archaeon]|nr:ferrous iron transport protein B [Methanosarcinaceae archaeon]